MKPFFDYCNDENWKNFIEFHVKEVSFNKNDFIFKEGTNVLGLYIINQGKVKVTRQTITYPEKLIRIASNGDIVGHRGFGGSWKYPVAAQCYENTTLFFIPLKVLNSITKINPDFSYNLMMFFAEELRSSENLKELNSVKSRIAYALLYNLKVFGYDKKSGLLNFTIPRKDIASFALTSYESVVRTLSESNSDNIIKIENKSIYLLNKEILQDIAEINNI